MTDRPGRTLRAQARGQEGVTLPELLVTMALMGVVGLLVLGMFTSFTRALTRERSAGDSVNIASIGMDELTRVVRSGTEIRRSGNDENLPVFTFAGRERLQMHAFLDTSSTTPRPVKIELAVTPGRDLEETRWDAVPASSPYWTFESTGSTPRRIASKILPHASGERYLFTYRTKTVCDAGHPDCNVLQVPAEGITDADVLRSIATVEITLHVQADGTDRAQPVMMTNQVGLPNLGIDRVGASQ